MSDGLTLETLAAMQRQIAHAFAVPARMLVQPQHSTFLEARAVIAAQAMNVTYSIYALKQTSERNFPESRNRSRRIHKKLCRRFGGEFRMVPTIWQTALGIIAHPSLKSQLEAALAGKQ